MGWYVVETCTKYNQYAATIPNGMRMGRRGGNDW